MSPIIKFKCIPSFNFDAVIEKVLVDRETENSVWINKSRQAKVSSVYCYFDTWEQAHEALIAARVADVAAALSAVETAKRYLGNVQGIKKPKA